MPQKTNINFPTARVFAPLLQPCRFKGSHGGRGSGKSIDRAEALIEECILQDGLKAVGIREVQKSIQFSVKELLYETICKYNVNHLFDVQDKCIKTPGDGIIIFQGLQNHTADSIKSLQGFDRFWAEEAQSLSHASLRKLRPTLREKNSEFWATWNPEHATDAIDQFLRHPDVKDDPDFCVVEANWRDNPWFPKELELERQIDLKRNPDDYNHIWEGAYLAKSSARVFRNWQVEEFDTPEDARLLFGADWGFSNDPTTLIRGFIGRWENNEAVADPNGNCLFLDHEAYKVGCSIDKTPDLFDDVPGARQWPIRADSARPETIDYMQRNGFPQMVKSTKGKGSIVDGVEFIKSYDVYIHPRCKHTADEFTLYSYKVDPKTEEILPVLEDDNNHIIDPIRYMLELVRRAEKFNSGTGFGPRVFRG